MLRKILAATAAASVTLVFACSSVDVVPVSKNQALDDFRKHYATTRCALETRCYQLAKYLADECPAKHDFSDFDKFVDEGHTKMNQAAADACLKDLASLDCNELWTLGESIPNTFPDTCGKAFEGQLAPGQPCYDDVECKDGVCALDASCPGVCRAKKHPGDPCSEQDCGYSDHACFGDGTCGGLGSQGDPCFRDGYQSCRFGLQCSGVMGMATKDSICVARAGKGSDCAHDICGHGLICINAVCSDLIPEGSACDDPYGCAAGLLCRGLYAESFSGGSVTPGVCSAPSDVGGACAGHDGGAVDVNGCATGLECVNGACAMPPTSGDCGPSFGCAEGFYCAPGHQCAKKLANGAACAGGPGIDQCLSGLCNGGVCAAPCSP